MATIVNEDFRTTAEAVRDVRKDNRMNQEEFARALGVGKSAVQNWEYGRNPLSVENVRKICQVFGVPPVRFGEEYAQILGSDPALKSVGNIQIPALDEKNAQGLGNSKSVARAFLEQEIPGFKSADSLRFYRVHGVELSPLVQPQDLLLVDSAINEIGGADLYIIEKNNWSFLRLCYRTMNNEIIMRTQSKEFRDEVKVAGDSLEKGGFKVLGKVVSTKLKDGLV